MPAQPRPDGQTDERAPAPPGERRSNAPVFEVVPVRTRTRVPFIALVGLVVGVAAFIAGIGVASAGPAPRQAGSPGPAVPGAPIEPGAGAGEGVEGVEATAVAPADAGTEPNASPVGAGSGPDAAAPTAPSSLPAPGSSTLAASLRPDELVAALPDGARCTGGGARDKEVPRTRRDGPRLTFQRSWLLWCEVPLERRQAFLLDVFGALVRVVPVDAYGFSAGDGGSGDALFPYAEPPLVGTVALTAEAAGAGFAIAIVLEEWRADPAE